MAVLIVGGLLGARYGALSLVMYLAMGAAGLPVFAPLGVPGFARLIGPTGGFLLAYPVAAAVTGAIVRRFDVPTVRLAFVAALTGMVIVFAGGMSQLTILTGHGVAFGLVPFAAADLVKVVIAALVIRRFAASTRSFV